MKVVFATVLITVVVIDQLSKATSNTITLNTAGPCSVAVSNIVATFVAGALLLVAVLVTAALYRRLHQTQLIGLALIIGGGITNLADRLRFGGVRDIGEIATMAFNLADVAITLGAIVLIGWTVLPGSRIRQATESKTN